MSFIAPEASDGRLAELGRELRARRRALGVTTTAAAQAAGLSRVTLHRIEKGEPTVACGAWMRLAAVLGLDWRLVDADTGPRDGAPPPLSIPARVRLADYPQLKALAWHVQGLDTLRPREAYELYERNARHLDLDAMSEDERALLDALRLAFEGGDGV